MTTSNELGAQTSETGRSADYTTALLERVLGEDVETMVRPAWPTKDLPEVVEKLLDRYEPDAVLLTVNPFAYNYESVPLRLRRLLGPFGRPVAAAGFAAGNSPRFGPSRIGRWCRRAARRIIGGDAYFEPADVVEALAGAAMRAVRRENTAVIVYGPISPTVGDDSINWEKGERRRQEVDLGLRSMCARTHVGYVGLREGTPPFERSTTKQFRHSDGFHGNRLSHALLGLGLAQVFTVAMEDIRPRGIKPGDVRETFDEMRVTPGSPLAGVLTDEEMKVLPFLASRVVFHSANNEVVQLG